MRYQVVALDSEIGSAMDISSIAWQRADAGDDQGHYYTAKIYMGLCSSDQLSSNFENNWIPGSRTLVFETAQLDLNATPGEWEPVVLQTPYWYNGQDNLLIEVQWASADTNYSFYTWKWNTGTARSVKATSLGSATGVLSTQMSELQLTGTMSLDGATFAEVKTLTIGGE